MFIVNGTLETSNRFQSVGNELESHKARTGSVGILFQIARHGSTSIPLMVLIQIEDKEMSTMGNYQNRRLPIQLF